MAYASDSDLILRVPPAQDVDEALREIALEDAAAMIDDLRFGDKAKRAHAMLAAHYLQIGGHIAGGEGGLVTARSAGEISVSYAVAARAAGDELLATTSYGRAYLQILDTIASIPEAV